MPKKTEEQISYNMKRVKNKGSEIEILLQKELWSRGLRYRKNVKGITGKPDIAFIGKKIALQGKEICKEYFDYHVYGESMLKFFKQL